MKNLYTILPVLLLALNVTAQSASTYQTDIERLYSALKTTPSYKDQIKGESKTHYEALYRSVHAQNPSSPLNEFYLLSRLIKPLKDNHLGFYQSPDTTLNYAKLTDSTYINTYRSSVGFVNFPKVKVDLDSLEKALIAKPSDGVEGIYYVGDILKAGVFRTAKPDSLVAVVLWAKQPVWAQGQLLGILHETSPNNFEGIGVNPVYRMFEYNRHIRLVNNNRLNFYYTWKKYPNAADYTSLSAATPVYQFKQIDSETQYLRLGRFATNNKYLAESQRFYDSVKTLVNAPSLIVDLRNNGGGGWKSSKKYLDLITRHGKNAHVYVLVNYATVSNAEQFTLKLKGRKNITVLGGDTKGMITYGSNYGKTETLPSGKYKLYLTDMRDDGNYLQYEDVGVKPDKYLNPDSDWVGQVLAISKSNNQQRLP